MLRESRLTVLFLVFSSTIALAQGLCPAGVQSDKLICLIPQVFGVNGLVLPNAGSPAFHIVPHFQNVLPESLRPVNSAISQEAALLPLTPPSSGTIFTWDPTSKTFSPSTDSLGPILAERADTIGRHRIFVGLNYQYFQFDTLDGLKLKNLPAVFPQQDDSNAISGRTCSINGDNQNSCGFIRDVIRTTNRIDLKIHQFTSNITFGLTDRIDLSMIVPVEDARMSVSSQVAIVANSQSAVHVFPEHPGCPSPCFSNSFANFRSASGIGDITFRIKGTAWKGDHSGLAVGVDLRFPTGDEFNFIGSGAYGVQPFVVWSYRSRISPHVFTGYEVNGRSFVAGDISIGSKQRLPSQMVYAAGADAWLTKWLTLAFDLTGQQIFQSQRVSLGSFTEPGACIDGNCIDFTPPVTDPNLTVSTSSFNVSNASIGFKVKPVSAWIVTGNLLLKLNDGGLRARVAPLLGISYNF